MDADALLEAVMAENERLRGRVDQLEGVLGVKTLTPVEWRLTGKEMCVFGVILERAVATKDAVMAALYRDTGKDEAEIKIVDVFVCKVRKKLQPFDIEIKTRWGEGYFMEPSMKTRVHQMMADSAAGQAA